MENQSGSKIRSLCRERIHQHEFKNILQKAGIQHQLTGYAPEQNGIVEKMNRTIAEKAKTMLINEKLSKGWKLFQTVYNI